MNPLGGKEAIEFLVEAIADFQILQGAPPDELGRAARRLVNAAAALETASRASASHTHSPHTPQEASGGTPPLAFITAAAFLEIPIPEIAWLWETVIPRGATACLSGSPKVGKTTWLAHFLRAACACRATASRGGTGGECVAQTQGGAPFLGHRAGPLRAAWVRLEEPLPLFRARLVELALGERDLYVLQPNDAPSPTICDIAALKALVKLHAIDLLAIDPLVDFLQVEDENDAALMAAALRPVRALAQETGCTVLLIHHDRKAEATGVLKLRGSTAISGLFDVILGLEYLDRESEPTRRLSHVGRYGRGETLCRLGRAGYGLIDAAEREDRRRESKSSRDAEKAHAKAREAKAEQDRALELLRRRPQGVTRQEGAVALAISVNRIATVFDELVRQGRASHEPGAGSKAARWRSVPESNGASATAGPAESDPGRSGCGEETAEEEL